MVSSVWFAVFVFLHTVHSLYTHPFVKVGHVPPCRMKSAQTFLSVFVFASRFFWKGRSSKTLKYAYYDGYITENDLKAEHRSKQINMR